MGIGAHRAPGAGALTLQAARKAASPTERPYILALDGAFEWGDDPLVSFSPTLSREYQSARKLFPNGFVEMNSEDADTLGVREGWRVKLTPRMGRLSFPSGGGRI